MKQIFSREQLLDRLRFDNPWWISGKIDSFFEALGNREYLERFFALVRDMDIRRGVILMGPRRVGKTVMIFHAIKRLLEAGVDARKIVYVSVDTPIFNQTSLEDLFAMAREAVGSKEDTDGFYVFFDEIQYLRNWEVHLKSLVDSYRRAKFVASGSAAAALKLKSNESGAGRFSDFHLPPLTFYEYLSLGGAGNLLLRKELSCGNRRIEYLDTFDIRELNRRFLEYLNFGGYPEIAFSEKLRADSSRFVRSDIIDKVLLRDLPSLYGITDVQELNRFFSVIAYHSGNEFSYESLSQSSEVRKETLRRYIEYLEAAFLIRILKRVDKNAKHFHRTTSFKIFLTNPSLRSAIFQPISECDPMLGATVETAVLAQLFPRESASRIHYANWREGRSLGEVDLVGLDPATQKVAWASEVKWSDKFVEAPGELKSLIHFAEKNTLQDVIVTTMSKTKDVRLQNGCVLHFIPASVYALNLSKNTLSESGLNIGL